MSSRLSINRVLDKEELSLLICILLYYFHFNGIYLLNNYFLKTQTYSALNRCKCIDLLCISCFSKLFAPTRLPHLVSPQPPNSSQGWKGRKREPTCLHIRVLLATEDPRAGQHETFKWLVVSLSLSTLVYPKMCIIITLSMRCHKKIICGNMNFLSIP